MTVNPVRNFSLDKNSIQYIGSDLQRPECILAERDGTLWSADARGGVVRLSPDGRQQIITQKRSGHFQDVRKKEFDLETRRFHSFFLQKVGAALERFQNCHGGRLMDAEKGLKAKCIADGRESR